MLAQFESILVHDDDNDYHPDVSLLQEENSMDNSGNKIAYPTHAMRMRMSTGTTLIQMGLMDFCAMTMMMTMTKTMKSCCWTRNCSSVGWKSKCT
jgi:hypothetical protein